MPRIDYGFSQTELGRYDELLNIEMKRKYSDTGFAQQGQWQASPRTEFQLTQAVNPIYTGSGSNLFAYKDRAGVSRAYRIINTTTNGTRIYMLQYATLPSNNIIDSFLTWTDIDDIYTSGTATDIQVNFDIIRIPVLNGTYDNYVSTTPAKATAIDRVKRNMVQDVDANTGNRSGTNAIGRIIMVLRDQYYTGVYGYVLDYDTTTDEYITEGTGMVGETAINVGATYKVYDTLSDCLRITSPQFPDYYYNGIQFLGELQQLTTDSLRKALIIGSSEYIARSTFFSNSYWTFNGKTIFESKGFPGNPFYYSFNSGQTVADRDITGLYVYRGKLIVYGISFIYAVSQNGNIEKLSNSIGVKDNAIYETGDDLYFISSDKKIISVNELASGTLYIKDITDKYKNYTQHFDNNCFIGSDGENIYFGGCKSTSGTFQNKMYMMVFSLDKKFWSVYECPPFKGVYSYNGVAYFTHRWINNNATQAKNYYGAAYYPSGQEYYPVSGNISSYVAPTGLPYTQRVVTEWEDSDGKKDIKSLQFFMENVPTLNSIGISIFKLLDDDMGSYDKKIITQSQKSSVSSLGTGLTGYEIVGGTANPISTLFPRKKTQTYAPDTCNSFKVVLESIEDTSNSRMDGFYISSFAVNFEVNNSIRDYTNYISTY